MDRFLFLDFDGVLNNTSHSRKSFFNQYNIDNLKNILHTCSPKVVLTTSWRFDNDIDDICKNMGINEYVVGKTIDLKYAHFNGLHNVFCRGNEIAAYLQRYINDNNLNMAHYEYPYYLILDDEDDILMCQKEHFFQTDYTLGLTETNAQDIINKIKSW